MTAATSTNELTGIIRTNGDTHGDTIIATSITAPATTSTRCATTTRLDHVTVGRIRNRSHNTTPVTPIPIHPGRWNSVYTEGRTRNESSRDDDP